MFLFFSPPPRPLFLPLFLRFLPLRLASSPSPAPIPFDSPPLFSMVEADFDLLTRLNSPTLRLIPRRALGQFARVWGALLLKAVATATHENWFSALAFPRVF